MSNQFIPLISPAAKPESSVFTAFQGKSPAPGAAASAFAPLSAAAVPMSARPACAQPAVTLQRVGEVVTAIRIKCPCGQVIQLDCAY